MAQPFQSLAAPVNAGGPAASVVTANTQVSTASGAVGIQTDVPQFSGPMVTGAWSVGASRCKVNGIPVINQAASGQAVGPSGATAPMSLTQGDTKVSGD